MRTRIWLVAAAALVICVLLVQFRPTKVKEHSILPDAQPSVTNPSVYPEERKSTENQETQSIGGNSRPIPSTRTEPITTPFDPNVIGPNLLTNWQAPIEFYGKVVDEKGNTVAEAKVAFHWVEVPDENGNRSTNTESDGGGLFSLQGVRGPSLSVSVSKDGYYPRSGGAQYGPLGAGSFSPDPHNPVVFQLRKKGQGVELITSDNGVRPSVAIRVPKNNTPVRVNFFQKQASSEGQLEISQNKPPWREATNWSFRLSIPNGGFFENQDEFQFEAPETNYQSTVEYQFAKSDTNWMTHVTKQFYIAYGEPRKYGWLRIESDLAQETVFLSYAINAEGSRYLEPK